MLLELDDFHRLALAGKTNGVQIVKAVDMTNTAHQELLEYGKYRIMSCLPIDLYTKVRKQGDRTHPLSQSITSGGQGHENGSRVCQKCHEFMQGLRVSDQDR